MECDEIKVELVYPEVKSPQEEDEQEEEEEEEEAGEEQEELSVAFAKYRHFEEFMFGDRLSASDHVLLADFVREWEDRLATAMAAGCAFSDTVLAFKGRCHEFFWPLWFFYVWFIPLLKFYRYRVIVVIYF
jgi:hypothetical protein